MSVPVAQHWCVVGEGRNGRATGITALQSSSGFRERQPLCPG